MYTIDLLIREFEEGKQFKFIYFWGHTPKANEGIGSFCFSQWYELPFIVEGVTYNTAEHWMMAQKALLFEDLKTFELIIKSNKPGEAKELGRQVLGFDELLWNKERFNIVVQGNIHKFNQHPEYAAYLRNTGDRVLVEASPLDKIWGVGLAKDNVDIQNIYAWEGLNLLGFALMEARNVLNEIGHFDILKNEVSPPWIAFPGIHPVDLFWRMGKGEDYLLIFYKYYTSLTDRDKKIFDLSHPIYGDWKRTMTY